MRPITVNVGPLPAAYSFGVLGAPWGPGQMGIPGVPAPGGANVFPYALGAAVITNGVLTGTLFSGKVVPGPINGRGIPLGVTLIGPNPNGPGWIVYPAITAPATTIRGPQVITLTAPRQLQIVNTEPAGQFFTIQGTDAGGNVISEVLPTNGGTLTTSQTFATITAVAYSGVTTANVTLTEAATATTPWVMFDPWAEGKVSYQADVNGVANFTVQITNDDPNSPTSPVAPGLVQWLPDPNASMVGASASQAAAWQFAPLFARVLLNSGAGSVAATFIQPGVVNR